MAGIVGIFAAIGDHIPILKKEKFCEPQPEGQIARFHYRGTTLIILAFCLLVTCTEWVSGTDSIINCLHHGAIPENVINTYCYIMGTFSVPKHYVDYDTEIGQEVAHTGVGPYTDDDYIEIKAYYQWVPFVLFLQAAMFYVPHLIYKMFEAGKLKLIIHGLHTWVIDDEDRHSKEGELAKYILETQGTHREWCLKIILAQMLYLVNVIGQIFFTDCFLGYEFSTYGVHAASFLEEKAENRVDPMSRVFPRMTKCTFRKFGPSGSIQKHDAQCVLPINIINEKIYVFLWFWFSLLAVMTVLNFLWTIGIIFAPRARKIIIKRKLWLNPTKNNLKINVDLIVKSLDFADWKVVYHLLKNMDALVFAEFCEHLTEELQRAADREKYGDELTPSNMDRLISQQGDKNINSSDDDLVKPPLAPSPEGSNSDDQELLRLGEGNYLKPKKESVI